jgi:hypothetical protein
MCARFAGGSFSSPTIGVATPLAGALAHARVIIFRLKCLSGRVSPFAKQQKTRFHAPKSARICGYCGSKTTFLRKTGADKKM